MKSMSLTLFSLYFLQITLCLISSLANAHPGSYRNSFDANSVQYAAPSKRAFDRLEKSPFDFHVWGYHKRDDDPFMGLGVKKRSFDRIESSPFGFTFDGDFRRKRAFDRLETSPFNFVGFDALKKRSVSDEHVGPQRQIPSQHPTKSLHHLSIADLIQQANEPSFLYFAP